MTTLWHDYDPAIATQLQSMNVDLSQALTPDQMLLKIKPRACTTSIVETCDPVAAATAQGEEMSATNRLYVSHYNIVQQWCTQVQGCPTLQPLVDCYGDKFPSLNLQTAEGGLQSMKTFCGGWLPVYSDLVTVATSIMDTAKTWGSTNDPSTIAAKALDAAKIISGLNNGDKSKAQSDLKSYFAFFDTSVTQASNDVTRANSSITSWQSDLTTQIPEIDTILSSVSGLVDELNALEATDQASYDSLTKKIRELEYTLVGLGVVGAAGAACVLFTPPPIDIVGGIVAFADVIAITGVVIALSVYMTKQADLSAKVAQDQMDLASAMSSQSAIAQLKTNADDVSAYTSSAKAGLDQLVKDYQALRHKLDASKIDDPAKVLEYVRACNTYWTAIAKDEQDINDLVGQFTVVNGDSAAKLETKSIAPKAGETAVDWNKRVGGQAREAQSGVARSKLFRKSPVAPNLLSSTDQSDQTPQNILAAIDYAAGCMQRMVVPNPTNSELKSLADAIGLCKSAASKWSSETLKPVEDAWLAMIECVNQYDAISQFARTHGFQVPDPNDAQWLFLNTYIANTVRASQLATELTRRAHLAFKDFNVSVTQANTAFTAAANTIKSDEARLEDRINALQKTIHDEEEAIEDKKKKEHSWYMIFAGIETLGLANLIESMVDNLPSDVDELKNAQNSLAADENSMAIYDSIAPLITGINTLISITTDCMKGFYGATGSLLSQLENLSNKLKMAKDPSIFSIAIQQMDREVNVIRNVITSLQKLNFNSTS